MNDRFKFRCWDKENKRFLHYLSYDISAHGILILNGGIEGKKYLDVNDTDRYILMQCTGLKDKNGKLIFEGDVVKHDLVKCDIVYDDYSFMAHVWLADDIVPLTELTDDFGNCPFNVIGNIYENEDLLNEQLRKN